MRLLLIIPYTIAESGIIVFARRLAKELSIQGNKTLLLIRGGFGTSELRQNDEIQFHQHANLINWLSNNAGLFDAIYWMGFPHLSDIIERQLFAAFQAKERFNIPSFFMWERTGDSEVLPINSHLWHMLDKVADGIVFLNSDQLTQNSRMKPRKILLSPGVNLNEFHPPESERDLMLIKTEVGVPIEKVVMLSVGRFTNRKRTGLIVDAWLSDPTLKSNSHLILIGSDFNHPDSNSSYIQSKATKNPGIQIIPHKFGGDWSGYYRAADICVLAGSSEGEPSVLSEALASRNAVIASDIPGHRELIHHDRTGLLFPIDNINVLRMSMVRLVFDKKLRLRLALNGYHLAKKERDIKVIAKKYVNFFSS